MPRACFLTAADLTGYIKLAVAPLHQLGWAVSTVSWHSRTDWRAFDAVIVRSTWDYHHHADEFLSTLAYIAAAGVRLENPLGLMRWNMHKRYLRDLHDAAVPVAAAHWGESPAPDTLRALFDALDADEIVLKPAIGASAGDVVRLHAGCTADELSAAALLFAGREYLAQPFLPNVVSEGEYSLIHFDGEFSHAIVKTPRSGDFRVQDEHGGRIRPVVPESALSAAAAVALRTLPEVPLYARVDLVRSRDNDFVLMELELIEPALYLRMDAGAPACFARALDRRAARV
ncbi:MAG TPA: hypothetical protein VMN60_05805 [Longimicrobiales bacterium]|nr:hypothetical protein [Longimicrobiales bacterium]